MDTLAIIKRIEMRLSEIGMSKADFYKKSGISSASFSQWRTGLYKPTEKKLSSAALCLGVSVNYLVSGQIAEDETSFANGIHVFRSSLPDRLDAMVSELDKGSYYIAYRAPGIVVAVDRNTPLSDSDVENLVNIYRLSSEHKEKAPADNGKRSVSDDEIKFALWGDCEDISDDDLEDVRRYAAFVRERKKDRK